MNKTKIDWCDATLNPVKGCTNNCEYCYARKQNNRFHYVEDWSNPQFFPEVLEQFKSKKPKSIFIDSMSDIGCWKKEWLEQVFAAMSENPQHNYIALTKCNSFNIILDIVDFNLKTNKKQFFNLFVGQSITTQKQADDFVGKSQTNDFLSVEPLLEKIDLEQCLSHTRTVIIGAETGNRKNKIIPKKEWVQDIVTQCDKHFIYVFMKESLRGLMGEEFRQDKLPWEIER